jgi:hypothetical protein
VAKAKLPSFVVLPRPEKPACAMGAIGIERWFNSAAQGSQGNVPLMCRELAVPDGSGRNAAVRAGMDFLRKIDAKPGKSASLLSFSQLPIPGFDPLRLHKKK